MVAFLADGHGTIGVVRDLCFVYSIVLETLLSDLGALIVPIDHSYLLDSLCPYFTEFPLSFPLNFFEENNVKKVFDPFCGGGTTLLAGRIKKCQVYGMDSNPFAAALTQAKLASPIVQELIDHAESIVVNKGLSKEIESEPFFRRCFSQSVLEVLCAFRAHFKEAPQTELDRVLYALVAGILHGPESAGFPRYLSNHMPRTFCPPKEELIAYWQQEKHRPPEVDFMKLLTRRIHYFFDRSMRAASGAYIPGDNRCLEVYPKVKDIDCVLCSPPYYGMDHFFSAQWLRLWLLGITEEPIGRTNQNNPDAYVDDLACVWTNCATLCATKATLVLRLGKVPGQLSPSPIQLFRESLLRSSANWSFCDYKRLPAASTRRRPLFPFSAPADRPTEEYCLTALLND